MHRRLTTILFLILCLLIVFPNVQAEADKAPGKQPARLKVRVHPDAKITIQGTPTKATGANRTFESPPLEVGKLYEYKLKATWTENGKPVVREEVVRVKAGGEYEVNLLTTVPYVPTPQEVVDEMLKMAKVSKNDKVYNLGCGDGRIVVTAAKKYGATGVGVDIDPNRIKDSKENVKKNKVEKLVTIKQGDVLAADISDATVVTLYLLPDVNEKLMPTLKALKPGTRIVSHDFTIGNWKPDKKVSIMDDDGDEHDIYLWVVKKKITKKTPDVIYVPTPQAVVDKMLEVAKVTKDDLVYDLGCGDGRIVVTAAKKYKARGVGFDVDPERIKESKENVKKAGVEKLVTIKQEDIFEQDLSKANVVTLYLLPSLNVKLIPQLKKLKPGSRIVSHDFDMRGVKPDKVITMKAKDSTGLSRTHTIYLWTTPLKFEN